MSKGALAMNPSILIMALNTQCASLAPSPVLHHRTPSTIQYTNNRLYSLRRGAFDGQDELKGCARPVIRDGTQTATV
jgi:hypothetical protein